ncbi:MAG: bifunctional riboflavin kinase/FAD synthetase [Lachnospiraceae bacterium]|nr:bifunctional riboflavin kinase/FAD synthetase [Lachnospiraceae bacterium]
MRIFSDINEFNREISKNATETAVAIGKFDGIHRGHQKLIEVIKSMQARGLKSVVFTFDMPPAAFFTGHDVAVLTTNDERREYLAENDVDYLIEYPVNQETISTEPEVFIRDVLRDKLNARVVAAGSDCSFGKDGRGNLELLRSMQGCMGFETVEVDKVRYNGEEISSTLVRSKVSDGDMEAARELLGHPYSFAGKVSHGRKLGSSELSMPTVNIMPEKNKLLPPFGVYFSDVVIGSEIFHGITNVGRKPTLSDHEAVSVETFLYDFDDDIYGENLRVELLHWRREERKFENLDALKKQMHEDMEAGRMWHKNIDAKY